MEYIWVIQEVNDRLAYGLWPTQEHQGNDRGSEGPHGHGHRCRDGLTIAGVGVVGHHHIIKDQVLECGISLEKGENGVHFSVQLKESLTRVGYSLESHLLLAPYVAIIGKREVKQAD